MSFDPSNIQELGIAIASFLTTLITAFLLFNGYRERAARALGFAFLMFVVWAWFGFFYYLPDNPEISRLLRVVSLLGEAVALVLVARFAFIYRSQAYPLTRFEQFLKAMNWGVGLGVVAITAADLFGARIVVGELLKPAKEALAPQAGPGLLLYMTYYWYVVIVSGFLIWRRAFREKARVRRAGIILGASIVASMSLAFTGFLPWYGVEGFTIPRALAVPLFGVAAFYVISSYQLFKLQVAAAQGFVFAIWGFMFFRILLHGNLADAGPDVALFGVLIILGFFLIRTVQKEVRTRFRLQELSAELKVLNESLEVKVQERTKALQRSSAHTAAVVEHLPVGLVEVEEQGAIVRINKTAQDMFGVAASVVGSMLKDVPELREALSGALGKPSDYAVSKPRRRDLEILRAPLVLEEGKGVVAVVRDVTEERALERAKSDFVSTAAHQLRTPLTAIKWVFTGLSGGSLSKEQQEQISQGATGAANMERIVEGLLLAARTSDGVMRYDFKELDINELVSQMQEFFLPVAKRSGITLRVELDKEAPQVHADRSTLSSALQNLIDNALKYTRSGGEVGIRVSHRGEDVSISVQDTGIGISPEDQQHIFSKFFRGKEAIKMATDGTGLGLFIVKSVVDAHGGTASFDSDPGKGSVFTVTLPATGGGGKHPHRKDSRV